MSVPPLNLSTLSYPKPTPPENLAPYSPFTAEIFMDAYRQELAKWNALQALLATTQELSANQQKMNESHAKLLRQYEEIQQQLLTEIAAHHEETQEFKKLKSDLETMTRFLHDLLIKK
jgi:predicted  nucleic acid-binding Zn-ribbon protein